MYIYTYMHTHTHTHTHISGTDIGLSGQDDSDMESLWSQGRPPHQNLNGTFREHFCSLLRILAKAGGFGERGYDSVARTPLTLNTKVNPKS
jgi:hypothetical protein